MSIDPKDVNARTGGARGAGTGGAGDDPRQAIEEGEPAITGRSRGRIEAEHDARDDNRTDPDALGQQGKKDADATTPHRESGDR